ncbi:MAG: hypothetical protein KBD01_08550 [Acidobacteria bacterium]|nr:hypothetical protein [Acidobacteriota bacterium]
MKRNVFAIIGIVAAAVIAVIVIGLMRQPPAEDVAGTVGQVTKYRAEQIGEGDVKLGGTVAAPEDAGFANLLGDSTTLANIAADLRSFTQLAAKDSLDAKAVAGKIETIAAALANHSAALEQRSATDAHGYRDIAAQLLEASANHLDAKTLLAARSQLDSATSLLEAKSAIDAASLNAIRTQLDAIVSTLDSQVAFVGPQGLSRLQVDLAAATSADALGAATRALEARSQLAAKRQALEARKAQLEAMSLQQQSVLEMRRQAGGRFDNVSALDNLASVLEGGAVNLQKQTFLGMRNQLEAISREHGTLGAMREALEASKRNLESSAQAVAGGGADNMKLSLAASSQILESSTQAVGERLGASMQAQLGAMQQFMGAKSLPVGPESVKTIEAYLGSMKADLGANVQAIGPERMERLMAELASATTRFEARRQDILGAKTQL